MSRKNSGHSGGDGPDRLPPTVERALDMIPSAGGELDFPDETIVRAELLCVQAMMEGGVSRTSAAVAAGSLYAAARLENEGVSQGAVGATVDVAAETVSTAYLDVLVADGFERPPSRSSPVRQPRGEGRE